MGWYDSAWAKRVAVTVAHSNGLGTPDLSFAIPANWDDFWSNVETTGHDIRITAADGETLLSYDVTSFSKTNRTGTIEVDAAPLGATSLSCLIWMYWQNSSAP